jgi:hypothetical protein
MEAMRRVDSLTGGRGSPSWTGSDCDRWGNQDALAHIREGDGTGCAGSFRRPHADTLLRNSDLDFLSRFGKGLCDD